MLRGGGSARARSLHRGIGECRSRNGNGMTTASIGKQGALAAKARVAFVTRNGGSTLSSAFHRTGHELLECPDWSSVAAADATAPFDLILCDEGMLAQLPVEITAPVLTLSD